MHGINMNHSIWNFFDEHMCDYYNLNQNSQNDKYRGLQVVEYFWPLLL